PHPAGPVRGGPRADRRRPGRARPRLRRRLDREGFATRQKAARRDPGQAVDIAAVIRRLRRSAPRWRPTALAEIAGATRDPFRVLIACVLSLRTQDRTTGPAAARLFAVADTPAAMQRVPPGRIARLIYPVGFYRTKARPVPAVCPALLVALGQNACTPLRPRCSACPVRPLCRRVGVTASR